MTREKLIERIRSLSDDDLARVAPYVSADLAAAADLDTLREEVRLGRESATSEALVEHDEVFRRAAATLRRPT